jgi:hypothetical protein
MGEKFTYLGGRRFTLALGKREKSVVLFVRIGQGVLVMERGRGGAHFDLGDDERSIQSEACAFSVHFLANREELVTVGGKMGRTTYQGLHHLRRRLEVEVETQVVAGVVLRGYERLRKISLDGGGDLVHSIQEVFDLEGRLRKRRAVINL